MECGKSAGVDLRVRLTEKSNPPQPALSLRVCRERSCHKADCGNQELSTWDSHHFVPRERLNDCATHCVQCARKQCPAVRLDCRIIPWLLTRLRLIVADIY